MKIAAISLFSGSGGLDLGCIMASVPVLLCIDNDPDCILTLKKNSHFMNTEIYQSDITSLPIDRYKNALSKYNPDKFIIIGGPPCQPFSKAGYWVGLGSRQSYKDPRNMFDEFIRIIDNLRPDGFLMENVASILHPVNRGALAIIFDKITNLNYHYKLLNESALSYGVPQKRQRLFIIASKRKIDLDEPNRTHFSKREIEKNGLLVYENVGKFISKYDNPQYFEREEVVSVESRYSKELLAVPPGKNYLALCKSNGHFSHRFKAGARYWHFLLKLSPDLPSWTISAQPGPWVGPFHWNNRRLRIPEIAAIQTFPENYNFIGTRRSVQKQIGNAVPPLMAKAMLEFLKEII